MMPNWIPSPSLTERGLFFIWLISGFFPPWITQDCLFLEACAIPGPKQGFAPIKTPKNSCVDHSSGPSVFLLGATLVIPPASYAHL